MNDAEFLGKLCAALLDIPQITGVSIDIRAGRRIEVRCRMYNALEAQYCFTVEAMQRFIAPDVLLASIVGRAREWVNAPESEQDRP